VTAFFWHGPPHRLLEQVREGSLTLLSSPALIAELTEVIAREKFDAILIRSRTSREHSLDEVFFPEVSVRRTAGQFFAGN
jgi:predicted nucleic acid-binding protein